MATGMSILPYRQYKLMNIARFHDLSWLGLHRTGPVLPTVKRFACHRSVPALKLKPFYKIYILYCTKSGRLLSTVCHFINKSTCEIGGKYGYLFRATKAAHMQVKV